MSGKNKGKRKKDFSSTPFSQLKGIRANVVAPLSPRVAGPENPPKDDDGELFLRAMEGVEKFREEASPATSHQPLPHRLDLEKGDRETFMEAVQALQLDVTFSDRVPEDEEMRPLPVNRMRQLRRGRIRLDYQLDLHGLTREEAVKSVALFIGSAYRRGQKAVLVITGKGNNSEGEPVLQKAVSAWLKEKGRGMVVEFFPAPRELGGGGAMVVFLKEQ